MHAAFAQMNPKVGDLEGNAATIVEAVEHAHELDVDLLIFPAHALTGWPLGGLAENEAFLKQTRVALEDLATRLDMPVILPVHLAAPDNEHGVKAATEIFVIELSHAHSIGMPELAEPGETFGISAGCDGMSVAVEAYWPAGAKPEEGDTMLLELCADTYTDPFALPVARGKHERLRHLALNTGCFAIYVNLCGAADDVVFAGGSCVFAPSGELLAACSVDKQEIIVFDTKAQEQDSVDPASELKSQEELDWAALTAAARDYVVKNGFSDVIIGLSGGIDSAVTAAVAADALGAEHVHGMLMPSEFSSEGSIADAKALAANLGIADIRELPIKEPVTAVHQALAAACGGEVTGLAAENLQARMRTVYLMTLSNANGWMLLNTGNKSEAAMGFSTLYGDTAGAYAPLGDLYKTRVYELARWRKEQGASIPQECIEKAPSAELYPGAKDEDRLPPYEELDKLLQAHIEQGLSAARLVAQGFDKDMVADVLPAVAHSEYKRRTEPIAPHLGGVSLTAKRAWPITNGWCDKA